MLLTEWNLDDAKEVWWEEAWEEGREEGRKEGEEKGEKKGEERGEKKGEKKMLHEVLELLKRGYSAEQIEAELSTGTDVDR
jgi:predicted transposase YdaD